MNSLRHPRDSDSVSFTPEEETHHFVPTIPPLYSSQPSSTVSMIGLEPTHQSNAHDLYDSQLVSMRPPNSMQQHALQNETHHSAWIPPISSLNQLPPTHFHSHSPLRISQGETPTSSTQKQTNIHSSTNVDLTLKELRALFDKPLKEAAHIIGISPTKLKSICRKLGIGRWPFRRVRCLRNKLNVIKSKIDDHQTLQEYNTSMMEMQNVRQELETLLYHGSISWNPHDKVEQIDSNLGSQSQEEKGKQKLEPTPTSFESHYNEITTPHFQDHQLASNDMIEGEYDLPVERVGTKETNVPLLPSPRLLFPSLFPSG